MSTNVEITTCEVCGARELSPVLDLGKQPLCDDLVPVGSSRQCELFPIEILYCQRCRTAHQRYQVPKVQLFPPTYHYRSRFTADVLSGMDELVASVEARLGSLADRTVLDVGCNDGSLLDKFAAKGAKTMGVEPTGAYEDALGRGHAVFNDFFSEDFARTIRRQHPRIDVITFTNVFAHIENLPALLSALALVMGEDTMLVVENHYLGAVLAKNQFDTFYHEHPRTYSLTSFAAYRQQPRQGGHRGRVPEPLWREHPRHHRQGRQALSGIAAAHGRDLAARGRVLRRVRRHALVRRELGPREEGGDPGLW